MKRHILLLTVLLLPVMAHAQEQSLRGEPGFLDMNTIESWFDREAKIEVNVQGALLNFVAQASKHEDEDLAGMLGRLKGVYVRGYDVEPGETDRIVGRAGNLASSLSSMGWETIVRVREDDERVDVFVRTNQDRIAGLVVMIVNPEETMFVNIVGEIDPEDIGRLGGRFNVPDIPDLSKSRQAQPAK